MQTLTPVTTTATVGQKFGVVGMTCHHCELAVTAELSKIDGVTRVQVDVAAGTVITESVGPLELVTVAAAVDEAGYEFAGVQW
jgi:copper chaperone CopZ